MGEGANLDEKGLVSGLLTAREEACGMFRKRRR